MVLTALPLGGVGTFGNLVYKSFGFTSLETVIFNIPRDGTTVIWFLFVGWACSRYPNVRFYLMLFSIIPAFIGMLAMALLPDELSYRWIKFGMYLMTMTVNVNGLMLWLFVPSNVAGRTKKSIVSSILKRFWPSILQGQGRSQIHTCNDCLYHMLRSQLYWFSMLIAHSQSVVIVLSWRIYLVYLNRTRDAAAAAQGLTPEQVEELGAMNAEKDMTDRQNPHFRYTY
ncbi:major facilitator superfamily transporter [Moniliophthora roreri]|nr:major facilitator superfamily transporter [Moniliophthora roreri]